ncbi:flagellar hook protein FlgE [Bacillus oleivorans]|uniref:Flagellar hook protein FlgE n=1 Tax=Bacillus oleivorans TaxID=1448271 RepID=A0A285D3B5_9BACI|nr:flagellar hook-basal body complex protein [Bacillus oleivorans]SNX73663.1 flagellar hook protein FlgE [Bacillus oleivorans]
MLRSMYSGISGLKNFQTKLDVIGNNIANVNTYGFKKGRVTFKDTMNQTMAGATAAQGNMGGKNPMQVGLGATLSSIDTIDTQGSLQTTGRSLDLAINGDGYFVVAQGESLFYTRAGNFYLDDEGTLVTADGYKVQSYQNGVLNDIMINVNAALPARQTTEIVLAGNLPNDAVGTQSISQQIKIIDSLGQSHTIDVEIAPNATQGDWDITFTNNQLGSSSTPTTVRFQAGDPTTVTIPLDTNNDGNAESVTFALDISGLTNNPGSITAMATADGNTAGALESYNIGGYGEINGVYSNGLVVNLGQLALAKFSNPSGLEKAGNNLYRESVNSGRPNNGVPGEGFGSIASSSLEMSNVDLSEEFTEMIVAQRGFQANTRIITTSDEILQELVNLKR